ncbi:hypothetical protein [Caballeronia sp. LZ035]|uniref:hypothetical protein n=1 Tax=Caballeronia sp. LZ035 TaxID=3038568 RepID=UPI00286184C9|nr:hypothetical protein [Caballeronia sp. LZ035]MDR5759187.1 hypothetical protein [Caballeronia sp. LZ035]
MEWLDFIAWFFGGVFFCNALPHLVSGVRGEAFQSPFATPPGEGLSSSTLNVVWGFFNLVIGYGLVCHVGHFDFHNTVDALAFGLGMLAIGLFLATHFGRFHGGRMTTRT